MLQHPHQHAFNPILHRSLTILPAPMGTQDTKFHMHLQGGTTRLSSAPITAFHRATQKSFSSTKRGRWGALHVCIAWKIYYHKQLKKMQQKPNSLHQELTPEYPATGLPYTEQPSCTHLSLDSSCGHSGKTAEHLSHLNRSYPSHLYTSSPRFSRMAEWEKLDCWEKLEQHPNLHWREKLAEKERHSGQQTDTAKDLPLREKCWDQTPELDSRHRDSLDRKRPLECDSFIKVKRAKLEIADDKLDSSKTLHTDHTHPSSHTVPVHHISDMSVLYPNSSRCNVARTPGGLVSYPGAEIHPYQTASWEPMWDKRRDLHPRQAALKDSSSNACKAIKIPLVAQRQKEDFHGFFIPPLYFPLALRQQETIHLRGRELLHSRQQDCHLHRCRHQLPHPGSLATSYLGP